MTRPHLNDLRGRVVRAHLDGEPIRSVVARFGVSVSSVPKWVARYRATGSVRRTAAPAWTCRPAWHRAGSAASDPACRASCPGT